MTERPALAEYPDLVPGTRVTMTARGREQFPRRRSYDGVITRRSKRGPFVTIQCDGYKGPERWFAGFWEPTVSLPMNPAAAPEGLT